MEDAQFPYEEWVADAFRDVLRKALARLAETGVSGDHHFFINFETDFEGVSIPGFLKAQYPEEITIVLQHQFEELLVDETAFQVTLSFSGQKHRLYIPFEAVTSFADPSVNFGLQMGLLLGGEANPEGDELSDDAPIPVAAGDDSAVVELGENELAPNDDNGDGAEVITLDAFRKK